MIKPQLVEKTMEMPTAVPLTNAGIVKKRRKLYYKLVLLLHDAAIACSIFLFIGYFTTSFLFSPAFVMLSFAAISFIVPSYFYSYRLYSFHAIFSPKRHMISTVCALGWSLLTLLSIFYICNYTAFVTQNAWLLLFSGMVVFFFVYRFFSDHLYNLMKLIGVTCVILAVLQIMAPDGFLIVREQWMRILFAFTFSAVFVASGRFLLVHYIISGIMRRHFRRQLIIIGSDEDAESIASHIIHHNAPYWVAGSLGTSGLTVDVPKAHLGSLADLPRIYENCDIDEIVVTDENIDRLVLISILEYSLHRGLTVWFPPKLMPVISVKLRPDNFCGLNMIRLCSTKYIWLYTKFKHAFDALLALVLSVLVSPLFLLISAMIKLDSKGPVFYRAKGIGKDGKIFTMYKFRTMIANNNSRIHQEYVTRLIQGKIRKSDSKGPLKISNDPRVTRVGKILRKFSLDELPQLINVVKAEMSLVGPRPCLPYEYEIYKEWHKKRTSVRPGITGLWQVVGRSDVDFEDMILLDLYYVFNRAFMMDLIILYETIWVVVRRHGAY